MPTSKQHEAKSHASPRSRRAEPGTKGTGDYYRIIVRPSSQFRSFMTQDVGDPGGIQRVAGHRASGSWATQAWLVSKKFAHVSGDTLVADDSDAKDLLKNLGSEPVRKKGDVFVAKDRKNVAEKDKPTPAQSRAWANNIKKAQAARHKS